MSQVYWEYIWTIPNISPRLTKVEVVSIFLLIDKVKTNSELGRRWKTPEQVSRSSVGVIFPVNSMLPRTQPMTVNLEVVTKRVKE